MRLTSFTKKFALGTALCTALVLGAAMVSPGPVYAVGADAADNTCVDDNTDVGTAGLQGGADCSKPDTGANHLFGPNGVFTTVTNIMLFIIGAIAVVMLIIGGIMYVLSSGEQSKVTSAKNTILYAIIGIVVAFLAYAAVNFVSTQLKVGTEGA